MPTAAFAAWTRRFRGAHPVCGLDYPFAIRAGVDRRFRRCPSSLYTFPFSGAWLGIAM
jgi:hypothetical protein